MRHSLILIVLAPIVLAACGQDGSDPVAGARAAQAAVKDPAQLPSSMPPEARASAAAAVGQANAMQEQNNNPARIKALKMMQQQHGG